MEINPSLHAAKNKVESVSLSLTQFTDMVLKKSLRSQTNEGSLISAAWGRTASLRELTWPQLEAALSESKSFSDNDLGTESNTQSKQVSLSLIQPFLSGTELAVASNWRDSTTQTDILGTSTELESKQQPILSASLSQPLFLFVRNSSLRTRRQTNLQWENSVASYTSERLNIEFDARALYYAILLQQETALVERKKAESAELVHNVTRALVKAGKLAEVELVRADIRAKKDGRRIQNAEVNREQVINKAKDLIGHPNDLDLNLTSKLKYDPFNISLERVMEAAVEHNPELQTARRELELAEISLQQTQEGDRPKLNATGSYLLTKDKSTVPLNPYSWELTLGLTWPLFDATQTRLRTQQSEISNSNTKRSYENQLRQLKVSVENAYLDLKRTEEQILDFETQRKNAETNLSAIRLQYRNGLTRLTDVFDTENEMRDLELEYLGLLVSYNTARDRLNVLIGGDIKTLTRKKRK